MTSSPSVLDLATARGLTLLLAEGAAEFVERASPQVSTNRAAQLSDMSKNVTDLAIVMDGMADAAIPIVTHLPESPIENAQALIKVLSRMHSRGECEKIADIGIVVAANWVTAIEGVLDDVLKKTVTVGTGETDGHRHDAKVDDETGNGATTEANGHRHTVEGWKILEADGHQHTVQRPKKKQETTTTIQTLIFNKKKFKDAASAKSWAKSHDFKSGKVDETDTSFRLRQRETGSFTDGSFRTIELADGVKAVVGRLKSQKADLSTGNLADAGVRQPAQGDSEDDKDFKQLPVAFKHARIEKAKQDERFVMGVVLEPETVDSQGDIYNEKEVRDAAHHFMERFGNIGLQHKTIINDHVKILESFLTRQPEKFGKTEVPEGTWLIGVRVLSDKLWEAVQKGDLTGFSIGGTAIKRPA